MKKLIITVLVLSLLALVLASCGDNRNNGGESDTKNTTPDTMLDPDDGKISDTGNDTNNLVDDIESGARELESNIMH